MRKRIFITSGLFLLFSLFTKIVYSQYWVHYCSGCINNNLCDKNGREYSTCAAAAEDGKLNCPGGGWWVTEGPSGPTCAGSGGGSTPGWSKSPVRNGLAISLLSGLVGSTGKDPNGKVLWDLGATGGFAVASIITTIAVPKGRPMGASIALGMINGASLTYAAWRSWLLLNDKPASPKPPKEVTKETLLAAAGGTLGGAIIGAISARPAKANSISRLIRRSKLLSQTAFIFSGNKLGIMLRF